MLAAGHQQSAALLADEEIQRFHEIHRHLVRRDVVQDDRPRPG